MSDEMPVPRSVLHATRRALEDARRKVERDKERVAALEAALEKMQLILPASKSHKDAATQRQE